MTQNQSNTAEVLQEEVQQELEQASLDAKLVELQALELSEATVNLWGAKVGNKTKRFGDIKNLKLHSDYKNHLGNMLLSASKAINMLKNCVLLPLFKIIVFSC